MAINALGQDAGISYVAHASHIISPGCAILQIISGEPPIGRDALVIAISLACGILRLRRTIARSLQIEAGATRMVKTRYNFLV